MNRPLLANPDTSAGTGYWRLNPKRLFNQAFGCKHPSRNLVLVTSVYSALILSSLMKGYHFSALVLHKRAERLGCLLLRWENRVNVRHRCPKQMANPHAYRC